MPNGRGRNYRGNCSIFITPTHSAASAPSFINEYLHNSSAPDSLIKNFHCSVNTFQSCLDVKLLLAGTKNVELVKNSFASIFSALSRQHPHVWCNCLGDEKSCTHKRESFKLFNKKCSICSGRKKAPETALLSLVWFFYWSCTITVVMLTALVCFAALMLFSYFELTVLRAPGCR